MTLAEAASRLRVAEAQVDASTTLSAYIAAANERDRIRRLCRALKRRADRCAAP